jgi:cytosine/uracil/thiamine/allantoin permease
MVLTAFVALEILPWHLYQSGSDRFCSEQLWHFSILLANWLEGIIADGPEK